MAEPTPIVPSSSAPDPIATTLPLFEQAPARRGGAAVSAPMPTVPRPVADVSPASIEAVHDFMAENEEIRLQAKQMNVGPADIAGALRQVLEMSGEEETSHAD